VAVLHEGMCVDTGGTNLSDTGECQHTTDENANRPTCPELGPVPLELVVPRVVCQLFVCVIEHHVAAFAVVVNEQEKIDGPGGGGGPDPVIEIVSTEMSPLYEDPLMLVKTT
jgi:hypothetical protein